MKNATRVNQVVVTQQSKMPTIDGQFNPDEYALTIVGLMAREKNSLYPWSATYGFSHDDERLYFAMSVQCIRVSTD